MDIINEDKSKVQARLQEINSADVSRSTRAIKTKLIDLSLREDRKTGSFLKVKRNFLGNFRFSLSSVLPDAGSSSLGDESFGGLIMEEFYDLGLYFGVSPNFLWDENNLLQNSAIGAVRDSNTILASKDDFRNMSVDYYSNNKNKIIREVREAFAEEFYHKFRQEVNFPSSLSRTDTANKGSDLNYLKDRGETVAKLFGIAWANAKEDLDKTP